MTMVMEPVKDSEGERRQEKPWLDNQDHLIICKYVIHNIVRLKVFSFYFSLWFLISLSCFHVGLYKYGVICNMKLIRVLPFRLLL